MTAEYITIPGETDRLAERLAAGKQTVDQHLQRGDSKAASLLGLFAAVLAGVVALSRTGVSTGAVVLLYLAAIPTAAAVVLLLWVLRPRLDGTHAGFTRWALFTAEPAALVDDLNRGQRHQLEDDAHHLAVLSAIAVAKYQRIGHAVYLLLLGLAMTALALLAA